MAKNQRLRAVSWRAGARASCACPGAAAPMAAKATILDANEGLDRDAMPQSSLNAGVCPLCKPI